MGAGRLFGALDIEREFADETSVKVAETKLDTGVEATSARLALGGAFPILEGAASLRASAHLAASGGDAREYGAALDIGMRF